MTAEQPDLGTVIDQNLAAFRQPGVLSVRPGYKIRNGWLTRDRSIVVTVAH